MEQQVQDLKLNVTNIKSILIKENKRVRKLDIKKKIKKEKKYPTKIQWKDRDKYFTYNFNNQKQKMFNVHQGIGVNPGDTPAETLKIIQKKVA